MSGTGIVYIPPYIRPDETCLGIWSTVDAVNTLREPSARRSSPAYRPPASEWTIGLPRYIATASRPCSAMIAVSLLRTTSNASAQPTGTCTPSRLTSGVVSRSGSASSWPSEAPFGQRKPPLNPSRRSPRTPVIRSSVTVSSRPQVASHSGQVVRAVRVVMLAFP